MALRFVCSIKLSELWIQSTTFILIAEYCCWTGAKNEIKSNSIFTWNLVNFERICFDGAHHLPHFTQVTCTRIHEIGFFGDDYVQRFDVLLLYLWFYCILHHSYVQLCLCLIFHTNFFSYYNPRACSVLFGNRNGLVFLFLLFFVLLFCCSSVVRHVSTLQMLSAIVWLCILLEKMWRW